MIVLTFAQHAAVQPLFDPLRGNLVVESVLNGRTRGRLYADNPDAPQLAVLWTLMDAVLLAGAPKTAHLPALRALLTTEMKPDAQARHVPFFTISYDRKSWAPILNVLLPGAQLQPVVRCAFQLKSPLTTPPSLPAGMNLIPLDETFFARREIKNRGGPLGWIRSFWPDTAVFARRGVGFAVVDGDVVASWALSVYAGEGALELGVETTVSHRGRGLATIAAHACLNACAARGITPHWQCDEANIPSVRLAQRLGFVIQRRFTALRYGFAGA